MATLPGRSAGARIPSGGTPAEAARMATLPGAHHCPEFPRRDGIAGQTGRFFGCVPAGVEHVFAL